MPIPLILIVTLLGLLFLYKQSLLKAKIFFTAAILMLFLFSNEGLSNLYLQPLESKFAKFDENKQYEYIFVLGGGHDDSNFTPLSSHLSYSAIKRISEGIMLLSRNPDAKIIFSGYDGLSQVSHAKVAASFAQAFKVEQDRIILFEEPQDTLQEAKLYKERIGQKEFILVTSATHMLRSMAIFQKLGLTPTPAPTDFLTQNNIRWYRFNALSIKKFEVATHEYLGLLWYKLRGYI